jgi:molybdopterin-biosynthesis enzyme MoeA-like protein
VLTASPNQTSSVHIRNGGVGPTRDDGQSRLILIYYYPKQSIFGH